MSENLEKNLNDKVGEQDLEKNLNENFSQSMRENLSENTANKNSYENLGESEQNPENLDKNSSEASSSTKNLSQAVSKCKAQNFFKNALEISMQGISCALIYAGKAGVWPSNTSNCLKDEVQRAKLSKINKEQAHILPEKVKELITKRLKAKSEEADFVPIYLAKKQSFDTFCTEYFYDVRAKFKGFLYVFKIGAANDEILNLKIKSQI